MVTPVNGIAVEGTRPGVKLGRVFAINWFPSVIILSIDHCIAGVPPNGFDIVLGVVVDVVVVNGRQEGVGVDVIFAIKLHAFLVRSNYVLLDLGLAVVNVESVVAVRHFITIQLGNKVWVSGVRPVASSLPTGQRWAEDVVALYPERVLVIAYPDSLRPESVVRAVVGP